MNNSQSNTIEQFCTLAERCGATITTEIASDASYVDCQIVKDDVHIYITFTMYCNEYLAYSLNSDIAPSELYMETAKDNLEIRRNRHVDIFKNVKKFLEKDLVYFRTTSLFNKNKVYIEVEVESERLRLPQ